MITATGPLIASNPSCSTCEFVTTRASRRAVILFGHSHCSSSVSWQVKKEEEEETKEVPVFTEIKVKKLDPIPSIEWWDKMLVDEVRHLAAWERGLLGLLKIHPSLEDVQHIQALYTQLSSLENGSFHVAAEYSVYLIQNYDGTRHFAPNVFFAF